MDSALRPRLPRPDAVRIGPRRPLARRAVLGLAALLLAPIVAWSQPAEASARPPASAADDAARAATCLPLNRRFDAAFGRSASLPPVPRLAALSRASSKVGEDPAGCVRERIVAIERAAREELVRLMADGTALAPSAVSPCSRLDPDLRCRGWVADDGGEGGELAGPPTLAGGARLRLALAPAYRPRQVRAYLAAGAAAKPRPLAIGREPAGLLALGDASGDAKVIVIVEEAPRGAIVKYVWSVRLPAPR